MPAAAKDFDPFSLFSTASGSIASAPVVAGSSGADPFSLFPAVPANSNAPVPSVDPITGYPVDAGGVPIAGATTTLAGTAQGTLVAGSAEAGGRIAAAAAQGYRDAGNPVMSPELRAAIEKTPLGYSVLSPALQTVGNVLALGAGGYRGVQQAIVEAGGGDVGPGRDIASYLDIAPMNPARTFRLAASDRLATRPIDAPAAASYETRPLITANPLAAGLPTPAFVPPGASIPEAVRAQVLADADQAVASGKPAFIPPTTTTDASGNVLAVQPPANALAGGVPREVPPAAIETPTPITPPGGAQPTGWPTTQAVGADVTPAELAAMTPDAIAAARAQAERKWLTETMQPGAEDNRLLVPGVFPTLAQREQTAVAARETKNLRNLSPEASDAERALLDEHNERRSDFFNSPGMASNEVALNNADKANSARIEAALANVWANKKTADAQPIVDQIAQERAGSAGELPPINNATNQILASLQDASGEGLKTDPQQLYRTRRLINYMQSKTGRVANPEYGDNDLQASLVRIKGAIDDAIEPAAPGFRKAMSDYATEAQRLAAQRAMQEVEPGLKDSQGRMQFSNFHRLMTKVIDARAPDAAANDWQGLSEAQFQGMKNLHDDLKRVASAADLERARGSDTAPNFADAARDVAGASGHLLLHGAATAAAGPGVGSLIVSGTRSALEPIVGRVAAGRRIRRMDQILRPDPAAYPTRNMLDPNAPP